MTFNPCAIIPTHNHVRVLPEIVARLRASGLPVMIVDDGSGDDFKAKIGALHAPDNGVTVHRQDRNAGKGAAVIAGIGHALAAGYTHALQIDADGQHDLGVVDTMLAQARKEPSHLISGTPSFDDSMPRSRRIGRWITHAWVALETLSFRRIDTMCGLRVYPLASVKALLAEERVGTHMDFDTEIMVRLIWRGVRVTEVPVQVIYPAGNTSNFDVWRDNWRITRMHTRLVFGMLPRLPRIIANRPSSKPASHWSALAERGASWGIRFLAGTYTLLGRRGCLIVMTPVVFYFYLTDRRRRAYSRQFLARAFAAKGIDRNPTNRDVYRHFFRFAERSLDIFAGWIGAIDRSALSADSLTALKDDPRGALLIVSHYGNAELARALGDDALRERITILVHTRHAENFNNVMRRYRPEIASRMVQVTEIGPDTAIMLRERVERGEWIAIAGDRSPVLSQDRVVKVPFLGQEAPFPQGPWLLAFLLECPVYILFCYRNGGGWRLDLKLLAERILLPRRERQDAIARAARSYAVELEAACLRDPFQWFNFFDFWAET